MADFRCNPTDPESATELDTLLAEFGVSLLEDSLQLRGHLIENLLWRKATPTLEDNGQPTLLVLLDLGEGDEVLLLTVRAGEVNAASHAGKDTR